jgi:hypothetical protein
MPSSSHGGSAVNNGTIELMINRKVLTNDELGNGERLNEYEKLQG